MLCMKLLHEFWEWGKWLAKPQQSLYRIRFWKGKDAKPQWGYTACVWNEPCRWAWSRDVVRGKGYPALMNFWPCLQKQDKMRGWWLCMTEGTASDASVFSAILAAKPLANRTCGKREGERTWQHGLMDCDWESEEIKQNAARTTLGQTKGISKDKASTAVVTGLHASFWIRKLDQRRRRAWRSGIYGELRKEGNRPEDYWAHQHHGRIP